MQEPEDMDSGDDINFAENDDSEEFYQEDETITDSQEESDQDSLDDEPVESEENEDLQEKDEENEEPCSDFEEEEENLEEEVEETPEEEEEVEEKEAGEADNEENSSETVNQEEVSQQESYLDVARRIQADFDNFRRHSEENIKKAKIDGQSSVIEIFLPCLDTFKEAKKNITDENILKGVEMIENKINEALSTLGVEKIESIGQVYDPHLHNVIAVMADDEKENDIILDEFQAGYKFNNRILRYAKVIVNKKED